MSQKLRKRMYKWVTLACAVFCFAGPSQADLVLYLPLDGDAMDQSNFNNHGTAEGDPEYVAGMLDLGMMFDASDDQIVVPSSESLDITDNITMSAWIKPGPNLTADWRTVLGKSPSSVLGQNQFSYDIRTDNSGVLRYSIYISSWEFILGPTLSEDVWYHVTGTYDGQEMILYLDGEPIGTRPTSGQINVTADPVTIGNIVNAAGAGFNEYWSGVIDDARIYNEAITHAQVGEVMLGKGPGVVVNLANNPIPEDGVVDVLREVSLAWEPGLFAVKHDVYFGTSFDDVDNATAHNPLGVLVGQGQTDTSYDAGVLEFGQTYYWRVDEVNGAPDNTVFKGNVWSFEVEPFSIPVTNIIATASSSHDADMVPEKTIDGSGLNALDQHNNQPKDMWLSGMGDPTPSIQYEFDKAYKLHEMWVWNSNQSIESFVGLGAKDVTVETSMDGSDWTPLANVPPFAQATGQLDYAHNTTVDFGGATAQYVRLTINAGHGMLPQYGLSELRFLYIPTNAREPQPADAATTDTVDVVLSWRAGREAVSHEVYVGTDSADLALVQTVTENSAAIGPLDYDTSYFWQIVEVNNAEDPSSHVSDLWSFSTPAFGIVDSFDLYDDNCNRIFFAWLDGLGHNGGQDIDDCDVPPYNGNGTGSIVGHANSPFAERTIVNAGSQSMPLEYDSGVSEATITLAPQDWTAGAIQSLSLAFYGAPGNTGQLYVKIGNTKVMYEGLPDALQRQQWVPWNIDLAATGANLSNVTSLTLGIENASALGMIYVDEIRLYPLAPETIDPVIPDDSDPNLVAFYAFEGNANDSTGNYPGTIMGEPTYTAGKVGQALNLDGTDDYIVHAFAQEEVWPAYSVSLWAKTEFFAQPEWYSLFNNNSTNPDFQIDVDGTDPGNYRYNGSSGQGILGPVTSAWVHLAVSCDGSQTSIYYNGLRVNTISAADTLFGQIAIGINRGMTLIFAGSIDDLRVYNRALSDAEAAGLAGLTQPIPKAFAE